MPSATPPQDANLVPEGDSVCGYCGAGLNPALYFCPNCATPYKHVHELVGRPKPTLLTVRERFQRQAPAAWPLFWTYFTILLGGGILLSLVFGDQPVLSMLAMDVAIAVTTVFFAITHFKTLRPQLLRPGFDQPAAWIAVAALPVLLLVNFAWSTFLQSTANGPVLDPVEVLGEAGLGDTALFLSIAVFPAISEEIAFRGLLQVWLAAALGSRQAIIISSALFSVVHFSVLGAPYLFLAGLLFGWVRWRTGSLYPCMVLHFVHNWWAIGWIGLG